MTYYKIDYKGKHFILSDTVDDDDFDVGKMDDEDISDEWLMDHVGVCVYFGIPAYIGKNKILRERVENVYKRLEDVGYI